jgi:wyosine [tRNA(Phe)-imidazoG37] synthetase (radical SAM superfamily)
MESYFSNHQREFEELNYIYPVISRRAGGLSLGINLNPDKFCNFDCPYCQVDRSTPSRLNFDSKKARAEILQLEEMIRGGSLFQHKKFENIEKKLRTWKDIAFSGDGEPSTSAHLLAMVEWLQKTSLKRSLPQVVVISNATGFSKPSTRKALEILQEMGGCVWAKLDAGTEKLFKIVSASKYSLNGILQEIFCLPRALELKIQTCFMKIEGTSPSKEEIFRYKDRLEMILQNREISEIQIYTIARKPAVKFVAPLKLRELEQLTMPLQDLPVQIKLYSGAAD